MLLIFISFQSGVQSFVFSGYFVMPTMTKYTVMGLRLRQLQVTEFVLCWP